MARQIGKMLNAREPKIVNGPEILDKYVGESEANIRKLFAEAEEDEKRVKLNWMFCIRHFFLCLWVFINILNAYSIQQKFRPQQMPPFFSGY